VTERAAIERQRATVQEIVDGLPPSDGASPDVLVVFYVPGTMQRLGHWLTPATAAPKPEARVRHLRAVPECAS
jgi:hypothetical protein